MNEVRNKQRQGAFNPVEPFELLEMKPLYPYILSEIKRLLKQDRRRLFLPGDSKIPAYLSGIEADEIPDLQLGDYPAIEALAFAVIEMLWDERQDVSAQNPEHIQLYDNNILLRGMEAGKRRQRA